MVLDALSRKPKINATSGVTTNWKSLFLVEYSKNAFVCDLLDGNVQDDTYKIVNDGIYYND